MARIVVDRYDGFYMLCALDGSGNQVACLRLNTSSTASDPSDRTCQLATVKWIGVRPTLRGQGIATKLYERAARLAMSLGRSLASDSVFLKAGRGFWQKQERKGRARKVGKRWILTCPPRTKLKNPKRAGLLCFDCSGPAERGSRICRECRRHRCRNPHVKKLSSGVVIVNAGPADRAAVIALLTRAGFVLSNYSSGTLAVGGATSREQVEAVLGPYLRNPLVNPRPYLSPITWARSVWNSLDFNQRWELGDELVLGTFDWRDWFDNIPPRGGMSELAALSDAWEETSRNPMPDEVFAGPPQPEVALSRDVFFTYSPPPSEIPWWAGGGVRENPYSALG